MRLCGQPEHLVCPVALGRHVEADVRILRCGRDGEGVPAQGSRVNAALARHDPQQPVYTLACAIRQVILLIITTIQRH